MVHSFAGIGLGKGESTEIVKKVENSFRLKTRWKKTQVLVIDES